MSEIFRRNDTIHLKCTIFQQITHFQAFKLIKHEEEKTVDGVQIIPHLLIQNYQLLLLSKNRIVVETGILTFWLGHRTDTEKKSVCVCVHFYHRHQH